MVTKQFELLLSPEEAFDPTRFQQTVSDRLHLTATGDKVFRLLRRSIDARSRKVVVKVLAEIIDKEELANSIHPPVYPDVSNAPPVIIVGAGPAGLFAALRIIEGGMKPIVLERGKDVRERRRDLAAINKEHVVNPESNYCFGEGGAGTYSDGKLYTRATKRGDVRKILEILVSHGAAEDILYDSHPHIGTNKLPPLVQALRERIISCGGVVRFNTRVARFELESGSIKGVQTSNGETIRGDAVILATGHSARDIFQLLFDQKILIEAKPFAVGVRVEHQQAFIDRVQYHCETERGPYLPASSYALVHQANVPGGQRGVFSFCMCPGGFMVPAATSPGEVVINGMSPSRRDSRFANSGIVVSVELSDLAAYADYGPLAGMIFQRGLEQRACLMAGGRQAAPAQRLVDFVDAKNSSSLLETSYQPGLVSADVGAVFPGYIASSLRQGFRSFGKKMPGYLTNEAQVVAVESRTSSPVRIPRDKETLEHPQVKGLYPCGEGAGFAGGIVSAAMDGDRVAGAVISRAKQNRYNG
jgi:uncharacterized FAD-dependent dehydrogenase